MTRKGRDPRALPTHTTVCLPDQYNIGPHSYWILAHPSIVFPTNERPIPHPPSSVAVNLGASPAVSASLTLAPAATAPFRTFILPADAIPSRPPRPAEQPRPCRNADHLFQQARANPTKTVSLPLSAAALSRPQCGQAAENTYLSRHRLHLSDPSLWAERPHPRNSRSGSPRRRRPSDVLHTFSHLLSPLTEAPRRAATSRL